MFDSSAWQALHDRRLTRVVGGRRYGAVSRGGRDANYPLMSSLSSLPGLK